MIARLKIWLPLLLLFGICLPLKSQKSALSVDSSPDRSLGFELILEMFKRCGEVETLRCVVQKTERYDGNYLTGKSQVKMVCKPYGVYLRQLEPKEGVEVLYVEKANNGKAIINPNGFPWMNISLDPEGSILRKNQHHTIYDMGFSKFNKVLDHLLDKYGDRAHELADYQGSEIVNGRNCHVVNIINPHYKLINYTVKTNETTRSIADKHRISEYRIVELNPTVSFYGPIQPGTEITLPNDYAPKISIFIDSEHFIPLRFEVYDDDMALFEAYEYSDVKINTPIKEEELSTEFPDYGF